MKNITFRIFIYIILLAGLFTFLDYILINYPNLIPLFGFITGCFIFTPLLQYVYIRNVDKKLLIPFLKHSIIGYCGLFILISIFFYALIYNIIPEQYIVYIFVILNLLIWCIYYYFFKDLF